MIQTTYFKRFDNSCYHHQRTANNLQFFRGTQKFRFVVHETRKCWIAANNLQCTDDDNRSYRNVCNMSFVSFLLAVIFIIRLFSTFAFRAPKVYPDVGFYMLKHEITEKKTVQKLPKNTKNNTWLRKYKKIGSSVFAFSLSRGGSHPCTPVSHTNCCSPVLHPFTVQEHTITGI